MHTTSTECRSVRVTFPAATAGDAVGLAYRVPAAVAEPVAAALLRWDPACAVTLGDAADAEGLPYMPCWRLFLD